MNENRTKEPSLCLGTKEPSLCLENPVNFTYRCVYYE